MPSNWQKRRFVRALKDGQVVAYPTEAVYGLGCDPRQANAVARLLDIKNRPVEKGLILIGSDWQQFEPYLLPFSTALKNTLESRVSEFITWVLPTRPETPYWLTGDFDTIAVRLVKHPLARELCEQFNHPIVSTSANLAGAEALRHGFQVKRRFAKMGVQGIYQAVLGYDKPSQIIDPIHHVEYR